MFLDLYILFTWVEHFFILLGFIKLQWYFNCCFIHVIINLLLIDIPPQSEKIALIDAENEILLGILNSVNDTKTNSLR